MPDLTPEQLARNKAIRDKATRDAEEWARSHIWALEDSTVAELYALFLDVFDELSQKLVRVFMNSQADKWAITDPGYRQRTESLLAQIDGAIGALLETAQDVVLSAAYRAYQGGAYARAWVLDQGLRTAGGVDLPLLPQEAIRAALLAPYEGATFLDRFANARAEFEIAVRRAIVTSQIAGDSIAQASRRLRDALGIKHGDPKSLFGRTEMIARTEILRSSNQGALATYEQNKDVLTGWEFIATKDERTCPICGALDGQQFKFDDQASAPPQHPRCRCSVLPVLVDTALQDEIAGPRETYQQWAARRGVSIVNDGGVLKFRGRPAPQSQTPAAQAAAQGA
jgi:SPP1 gp7 family putative phage head morphogenesis protein